MRLDNPKTILKYLRINALSREECYYVEKKNPDAKIPTTIVSTSPSKVTLRIDKPVFSTGSVIFFAFNHKFSFDTQLNRGSISIYYDIRLPSAISLFGKRKSPRLNFELRENKIIKVYFERLEKEFSAIIFNICIDGIAFFIAEQQTEGILSNEVFSIDDKVMGVSLKCFAKIRHRKGNVFGCQFLSTDDNFKTTINRIINRELEWRSDVYKNHLESKNNLVEKIQKIEEDKGLRKHKSIDYLDFVNPFLQSTSSVVDSFLGLKLKKKELKFEKVTTGLFDASTFFDCESKDFKFQFFFCLKEEILLKMAEIVFNKKVEKLDDDVKDLLGEFGNMIVGNAKSSIQESHRYSLSTPGLIIGKRHVLSTLSQYPSIRITFASEIGDFNIVLFINDLIKQATKEEIEMSCKSVENMQFIEPIYNSTINIFSNFLNIDLKEKSLNIRNPLLPKYEVSAFLNISNEEMEGKVVLNLSKKMALKIYEILLNEQVEEFDEYVKDAVGETLNMITGNAKKEFLSKGLFYRLSIPFIVEGKDQIIKNVGATPFVSSIYWSSEGYFELSFTIFKRNNGK